MTPRSVLEAISQGFWDYEPQEAEEDEYVPTDAIPGSRQKLDILAERLESGLPLWHPEDRRDYERDVEEALA